MTSETTAGHKFASFGPGSLIAFPSGSIYGERWIKVGAGTMIGEHASICAGMAPGHDLGPDPVLRIGDRCVIGRGSHVVAHHSIEIGDDVFTGPYVYITDQNHSYADPDLPIGRQWPVNAPVRIGAGTWLGTGAIVLPGSVIGRNVVVAAGAVVRGVIADRCVVAGVPARIVKDFDPQTGWTRRLAGDLGLQFLAAPSGAASAGIGPNEVAPAGMGPNELAPSDTALAELAPSDTALAELGPSGITPSGVTSGDMAQISANPGETEAVAALAETAFAQAEPAGTVLTDPLVIESSAVHPFLAEQDS